MFKASSNTERDLFKDISSLLSTRKQKLFESEKSWHNVFNREIINRIDERPYSVLYSSRMGRPNAPVRILIGMMILKEGNGWSDEQLFEECRFNLKVMRALGLNNIDDDVPTESTYYEFRKLLGVYNLKHNKDLLKSTFDDITAQQVSEYGVKGKKIRLDSKLINSNIAKSNRLDMIVEAVRKYVQSIDIKYLKDKLDSNLYELLKSLQNKSASNITYPLNSNEKKEMLVTMGNLISILLKHPMGHNPEYLSLLERLYKEQYEEVEKESDEVVENNPSDKDDNNEGKEGLSTNVKSSNIVPKKPKDIDSSSMQSVHDPEATYRTKGQGENKQNVSGYHANITESCTPDDPVNLIIDVNVETANVGEDTFLIGSVENAQKIIQKAHKNTTEVEEVITDGGYDSVSNRSQMLKDEYPNWSIAKMKGGRRIYKMSYNEQGDLEVFDRKTGAQYSVSFSEKAQKYVIHMEDGKKRYMTKKQIEDYIKSQQIEEQVNKESYNLRASVESTIHQVFHRLKKRNKVVYRGLAKTLWYVLSRALWVNMVRIMNKNLKKSFVSHFSSIFRLFMTFFDAYKQSKSLATKKYNYLLQSYNFDIITKIT